MIEPLNLHYAFTNPATVHDEEALTSLELAGRQGAKINEVIRDQNALRNETDIHLLDQDEEIKNHKTKVIPQVVEAEFTKKLNNGTFDQQISRYASDLENRLNNMLGKVIEGSTTMDAEVIDLRSGVLVPFTNAGESMRESIKQSYMTQYNYLLFTNHTLDSSTGKILAQNNRKLSSILHSDSIAFIQPVDGYKVRLFWYDKDLNYTGNYTDWTQDSSLYRKNLIVSELKLGEFFRMVVALNDDTEITAWTNKEVNVIPKSRTITDIPIYQGTISSGKYNYQMNRIVSGFIRNEFYCLYAGKNYNSLCVCYDENFEYIGITDNFKTNPHYPTDLLEGTAYVQVVMYNVGATETTPESDHGLTIVSDNPNCVLRTVTPPEFLHEVMNTAYSSVGLAGINSEMHFRNAAHVGFNSLKADVRITSDNGLVLCHDAGITLDENGKITDFDANNCVAFKDITMEEALALEYADEIGRYHAKLCTLDKYLAICVEENKIAYLTLRDVKIPELVAGVYKALEKYNLVDRCIINSYSLTTLLNVRKYSNRIPLSQVIDYKKGATKTDVMRVKMLGNSILTLFYYPAGGREELMESTKEALDFAKDNGVIIHMAQVGAYEDYIYLINAGVKGFHITKPFIQYHPEAFGIRVQLSNGVASVSSSLSWAERYEYTYSFAQGVVDISAIKRKGSNAEFDDGLPMTLFDSLPYQILARNNAGNNNADVRYIDGHILLDTLNVDGVYHITIII